MKKTLSALFLFYLLLNAKVGLAQNSFQRTYGGANDEEGISFVSTYDGNFAILANETDSFTTWIKLIKIDTAGIPIWEKRFNPTTINFKGLKGLSMQSTPDSGFMIATCYSIKSNRSNLLLIKLNSIGDTLWTKSYSTPGLNYNQIWEGEVINTSDGGYAFGGTGLVSQGIVMLFLKVNAQGEILWLKYYPGISHSFGYSIKETINKEFLIAGRKSNNNPSNYYSVYVIKTDSSGNFMYSRNFGDQINDAFPNGFELTPDGGAIVSGYTYHFNPTMYAEGFLLKIDSLSNIEWIKSFGSFICSSVTPIGNDFLGIARTGANNFTKKGFCLFKTDSLGNILWTKCLGGNSYDYGNDILVDTAGCFILGTTRNFSHGLNDIYLIKTNSLGDATCNTDTNTISPMALSWNQDTSGNESSGFIADSSQITISSSLTPYYDACFCIPPVADFNPKVNIPGQFLYLKDFSTWADTWYWDFGNGDTSTYQNPTPPNTYGTYYVCLTVTNSCGSDTYCDSVVVTPVGIDKIQIHVFNIFPNPAVNFFTIKNFLHNRPFNLKISDPLGNIVYSAVLSSKNEYVIHPNISSGFYFVKIEAGKQQWVSKLIFNKN